MSIKVYEAYRIRRGVDPFQLLWDIKRRGQQEAQCKLKRIYEDVLSGRAQRAADQAEKENVVFREWLRAQGHDPEKPEGVIGLYIKWSETDRPDEFRGPSESVIAVKNEAFLKFCADPDKVGVFDIDRWAHQNYREQLSSLSRNSWNLDVSVSVRRYKKRFYLLPHCDSASYMRGCLDFLNKHEGLEDFAYWNNTDEPEEVSQAQWARRARVWGHLTDLKYWFEYLSLDIVSWQGWHEVSPMLEIARANKKTV